MDQTNSSSGSNRRDHVRDIKRHEHIALTLAWVLTVLLTVLGIVTVPLISKWLSAYLKAQVKAELDPHIKAANDLVETTRKAFEVQLVELRETKDQSRIYLELIKAGVNSVPGSLDYEIQFGEREVAFNNANYLTMEQKFDREFRTTPNVFVGEGRGGSWLIVKVDEKDTKKFKWAANNLLGASNYATVIQWVAIAKLPKKDGDDPHNPAAPPPDAAAPAPAAPVPVNPAA